MQMLVASAPRAVSHLTPLAHIPTTRSSTKVLTWAWRNRWFLISEQCGTDWQNVIFLCMIYTITTHCIVAKCHQIIGIESFVVSLRLEMKSLLACCFIIFMAKLWKVPILSCSNNPLFRLWRSQQRNHPSISTVQTWSPPWWHWCAGLTISLIRINFL